MPMAKTVQPKVLEIDVITLRRGQSTFWLVGETPFYCNRMAAKAKRELLMPRGRLTTMQRATKLKHAPFAEYRDSPYLRRAGEAAETKFMMVGSAPKKAVAVAALRMPSGVSKAEINALVSVPDEYCPLWGIPRLDMSVVRMAGISRTPDIRTRAKIDRWAMRVPFRWTEPMLNEVKVTQLVLGGGLVSGLGDWRIEKGGSAGGYRVVEDPANDHELRDIIESSGFVAQEEALANPVCSNSETEELLAWYLDELGRRGIKPEDEQPEDIEVEDPSTMIFGAGQEHLIAPGNGVDRLAVQEGDEG
jgi:hypothetical protein